MSSMRMRCHLAFNGKAVEANIGETLIDAALGGSMLIPHDCRSGQCQSCRVTVVSGSVDDRGTAYGRTVLACQATVSGNVGIEFEELPMPVKRTGAITEINLLSPEIVEVVMTTTVPLEYRPGQYIRLKLSGFPARESVRPAGSTGRARTSSSSFTSGGCRTGSFRGSWARLSSPGTARMCRGPSASPIFTRATGRSS